MYRRFIYALSIWLALWQFSCHSAVGDQEAAIREQIEKKERGFCNPKDRNRLHPVSELWFIGASDEQLKIVRKLPHLKKLMCTERHTGPSTISDDGLKEMQVLTELEELGLTSSKITDAGIVHLTKLPKLRKLYLGKTLITSECFTQIAQLPSLEELSIHADKLAGSRFGELKRAGRLKRVGFGQLQVTAADLKELAGADQIEELSLSTSAAGLAELQVMPRLTKLYVTSKVGNPEVEAITKLVGLESLSVFVGTISEEAMAQLSGMPKLRYLGLVEHGRVFRGDLIPARVLATLASSKTLRCLTVSQVGDEALESIGKIIHLEELSLYRCNVSDDGIAALRPLKELKKLDLSECHFSIEGASISDESMRVVGEFEKLEELKLPSHIGEAGIAHLVGLAKLRTLILSNITDEGMKTLEKFPALRNLNLGFSKITDASVDLLLKLDQLEDIDLQHTEITHQGILKLKVLKHLKSLSIGSHDDWNNLEWREIYEAFPDVKFPPY